MQMFGHPSGAEDGSNKPVIVFVHGGGQKIGSGGDN
jgi:carboxylesterase type B